MKEDENSIRKVATYGQFQEIGSIKYIQLHSIKADVANPVESLRYESNENLPKRTKKPWERKIPCTKVIKSLSEPLIAKFKHNKH
jgi:hypothetical protein